MTSLDLQADTATLLGKFDKLSVWLDLADLLEIDPTQLEYYSYGKGHRYRRFLVRKRRGGKRVLMEPSHGLKIIQQKLLTIRSAAYHPRDCVHGFVEGKSIATNALAHSGKQWVFNVDLRDFFPSIHFGRVRGMLIARPYSVPPRIATVIAQLCTAQGKLPQGAPTSPVISNMVAAKLDADLNRLARRFRCVYTRYADDLTFSSDSAVFPSVLGSKDSAASPPVDQAGPILTSIIETNDFRIHPSKVRLRRYDEHQEVTGLTVNKFPNVKRSFLRRIRAMLHAWENYGHDAAQEHYLERYDTKDRGPYSQPVFKRIVKGHIDFLGMIRGTDHPWYLQFISQYADLDQDYEIRPPTLRRPNHLPTWRDAIWVVETDAAQGTGFELAGCGLVTCAHVVEDPSGLHVYHPDRMGAKHDAKVVGIDADLDLAVLRFEGSRGHPLQPKYEPPLQTGEAIHIAGYPKFATGAGLWKASGRVTQRRRFKSSPRYIVDCPIIQGASGSPVMDSATRVVGVAKRGVRSFADAAQPSSSDDYGVIPISLLRQLSQSDARRS